MAVWIWNQANCLLITIFRYGPFILGLEKLVLIVLDELGQAGGRLGYGQRRVRVEVNCSPKARCNGVHEPVAFWW